MISTPIWEDLQGQGKVEYFNIFNFNRVFQDSKFLTYVDPLTKFDFGLSKDESLDVMDYAVLENRIYLLNRDGLGGLISFSYSLNNKVSGVQKFSYP